MTKSRKMIAVIMATMIGIATWGINVSAADFARGIPAANMERGMQPRSVTIYGAGCSSTEAHYMYFNNAGDPSFMEVTGYLYDILGQELESHYAYRVCGYKEGIANTIESAGIDRFNIYAYMYDGPNAGYKCIDKHVDVFYAQ